MFIDISFSFITNYSHFSFGFAATIFNNLLFILDNYNLIVINHHLISVILHEDYL